MHFMGFGLSASCCFVSQSSRSAGITYSNPLLSRGEGRGWPTSKLPLSMMLAWVCRQQVRNKLHSRAFSERSENKFKNLEFYEPM